MILYPICRVKGLPARSKPFFIVVQIQIWVGGRLLLLGAPCLGDKLNFPGTRKDWLENGQDIPEGALPG